MFERAMRAIDQRMYGSQIELNELLKVRFESPTSISLHVTSAKDREEHTSDEEKGADKKKSLGDTPRLWRDALTTLAKIMSDNPEFKNAETVTFTTWLPRVPYYERMLKNLGFYVDINDEDPEGRLFRLRNKARNLVIGDLPEGYRHLKPCFTKISRTELLKRYSSDLVRPPGFEPGTPEV